MSKAHKRGKLVMIAGALITGGITISYWIDLGLSFAPGSVAWRFPLAFQLAFCLFILTFIPFLPESPRWLVLNNRDEEAKEVLAALGDTTMDDRTVEVELAVIKEMVAEMSKGSFKDLFTMDENRNLHRTALGYVNQMFQQISGINLITYYAPTIYANLGMSGFLARLLAALNGTEYFIASWPAVFLIEKVGRRKLMLFGAAGQVASMAILCGVNSNQNSASMQACAVVSAFLLASFGTASPIDLTVLSAGLPLRLQHLLRRRLAGHDLALPCRNRPSPNPCTRKRPLHLRQLDL
jgi:MFS family permease